MQSKLLIVAAVATGAVAIRDLSGTFPQNFRRGADALEARDEAACFSLPTALATATDVEIPQITDPCQFPSVTGSAGQLVTSYSSALQSWQDAHITEIRSLWSACSDVPQISSLLDEYGNGICSTALAPITANGTAATTATATATVTGEVTVTTTGDATGATASGDAASTTASPAAAAPARRDCS
ncbi:infection structure specific protein [Colletotrichum higginsianum]|nr:infection structure specific protein [Colletotrichum higginsianum]